MKPVLWSLVATSVSLSAFAQGPGGTWEGVIGSLDWPQNMKAVHMIHLHTANPNSPHTPGRRVLMFGHGAGDPATGLSTVAYVFDPYATPITLGSFTLVSNPTTDLFCSGHSALSDGRVLVEAGGFYADQYLPPQAANRFDPATSTWTLIAPMNARRWYPTSTTLPDGRILVCAGIKEHTPVPPAVEEPLAEFYAPDQNTWVPVPASAQAYQPLYPYMFVVPDGNVFDAGPYGFQTRVLNLLTWTWGANMTRPYDAGGSAVTYDVGKIMKCGGYEPAVKRTLFIDFSAGTPTGWTGETPANDMIRARGNANLTILPNGKVLATGGNTSGTTGGTAWLDAEQFDPATGTWASTGDNTMEPGNPRWYHSTAVLLRDARVLTAGGDFSGAYQAHTGQIFRPDYLDGTPERAVISAPMPTEFEYGTTQTFNYTHPSNKAVSKACLIRLGAVTHSFNQDQRYIPLTIGGQTAGVSVTLTLPSPANARIAPPGYYFLFIMTQNTAGGPHVPCVEAATVRVWDKMIRVYAKTFASATVEGGPVSGNLWWGDNRYVTLVPINGGLALEINTTAPSAFPPVSAIKFRAESSTSGFVSTQSIEFFNYVTSQWVQVVSGSSSATDGVMETTVTTNPGNYIQSGTRAMKARINWGAGPVKADEAVWMLKP